MEHDRPDDTSDLTHSAPNTLEGWSVLHQMFRLGRAALGQLDAARRNRIGEEVAAALSALEHREDGDSAIFSVLGHKADLLVLHFRRGLDDLVRAEEETAKLGIGEFLEPMSSYVSVVEIGLYESTLALNTRLSQQGVRAHSPEWNSATEAELEEQRRKLAGRLWPRIPARRYLCFYPMNKRREGQDNWYMLPIDERRRLMREHGMIGRRWAGKVTQVISGSIGFDDWEWGVDLFADDPLVFKKLVYEMRFDESSARYAEFGPFYVGVRLSVDKLSKMISGSGA